MNQFKEDVLKELQDVKLSQQRKQVIAEKHDEKFNAKRVVNGRIVSCSQPLLFLLLVLAIS